METGTVDSYASYNYSAEGIYYIDYRYEVQSRDRTDSLDYQNLYIHRPAQLEDGYQNTIGCKLPLNSTGHGLISQNYDIVVDGTPPEVESVSSPNASRTYGAGETIAVNVTFTRDVEVDTSRGRPLVLMETGATDRNATYHSGSGTPSLLFMYAVQFGDASDDLDYAGESALSLNGGSITDAAAAAVRAANLTLPAPGTDGLLAGSSNKLVVDGVRPTVDSVSSPDADATYGIGSVINVTVTFDGAVTVDTTGGTPTLLLETGDTDSSARYVSGSPGQNLLFQYTVAENDASTDLDYNDAPTALSLNGGSITDGAGNPANAASLSLSDLTGMATLAGSEALVVDGVRPTVDSVTSPDPNDTYGIGTTINVTVTFDEAEVTVDETGGTPYITLDTGEADRNAGYVTGTGTPALTFQYTVAENDTAARLDYAGASALSLNGGTITDGAGNLATASSLDLSGLTGVNTLAGSKNLVVDGVPPMVLSVSSLNSSGVYSAGDSIIIRMAFDDTVVVDTLRGWPTLLLETGRPGSHATYQSGTGTAELLFRYIVAPVDEAEDLDYASESSLVLNGGTIRDAPAGNDADLGLPEPGQDGLLPPGLGEIAVVHVAPPLIPQDSADTDDAGYRLGEARAVDAFGIEGRTYAVVAASANDTVQLVRVHDNGTLSPEGQAIDMGNRSLRTVEAIDAFQIGDDTFAIAASTGEGVQLIRVHGNNDTLGPAGRLEDTGGTGAGGLKLMTAADVAAFDMGGATYALVTTFYDGSGGSLQLIRVHGNGTLYANASMSVSDGDPGFERLESPHSVAAFGMGGATYALVTSTHGDVGVHLVRVRDNATLAAVSSATDGNDFEALNGTRGVDVFVMGGATYAMVASALDDAVQLIRVNTDGTLAAVSSAFNGAHGFDALDGAHDVSVFNGTGGEVYAIVASKDADAVQLIHVHPDGHLLPAGSATEGTGDGGFVFDELDGAHSVASFDLDGSSYAAVASDADHGVQLVRMSPVAATGASTETPRGAYGPGANISITVAFSGNVTVAGTPGLRLNSSGTADYQSGNNSRMLEFLYEVGAGDHADMLDYDGRFALYGGGGTITEEGIGVAANLELPAPGDPGSLSYSREIKIDGIEPRVASVAPASPGGAYGRGERIEIAVAFSEPVSYSGAGPVLNLNVSGDAVPAAYARGNGTAALTFAYTVREGDMPAGLAYHGRGALSGTLSDAVGNAANLTLPAPGARGSLSYASAAAAIVVDGAAPRVTSVASATPDGAYREGERIEIAVAFAEPVSYLGVAPRLLLNVSGAPAPAAYDMGNDSNTLTFAYTVQAGDTSDKLAYWNTTALSGALADAAGNAAVLALPEPGEDGSLSYAKSIRIDTDAPRVVRVAAAQGTTPDREYGRGERIGVAVAFTEPVSYSGARPVLQLNVSGTAKAATYESGNGTATLVLAYTVGSGDVSDGLAYWNTEALSGSIVDAADNPANRTLPAPGDAGSLSGSAAIVVDGVAPRVSSVTSGTDDGEYGAEERIEIAVAFTESVSYSGDAPVLLLNVSGAARAAAFASGNDTSRFVFSYTVGAGDMSDDLAYWNTEALSGNIADRNGNAANLALPPPGSPGSLSASASVAINAPGPAAITADAAFAGPNKIRIEYGAPLGPPAGYAEPVYGEIAVVGGDPATREAGSVSGLGTAVHTVLFGGDGVAAGLSGTIRLNANLSGTLGGVQHSFAAGSIHVRAGEAALALAPAGPPPVVAIERDEFVRAVNATGSGDGARPAINVSGLAGDSADTVRFPAEAVGLAASFAEVTIPPNATARFVPADGRLDLYLSSQGPTVRQVAAALGASPGAVESLTLVEVGDNATHIVFDLPVRILLTGQANGSAFYVNNTDRRVVPILAMCSEDDTAAVHGQLNGTGIDECWLDSAADKVIYTYHLTLFGTAMAPGGGQPFVPVCGIELVSPPRAIEFGSISEGGRSADDKSQGVRNAGTLPLDTVTIRASAWTDASGAIVMPANATGVMTAARGWVALDGETAVPGNAEGATARFRLAVPADALPEGAPAAGVAASQTVTYTAMCGPPP